MQFVKSIAAVFVSSALFVGASTATMAAPMPQLNMSPGGPTHQSANTWATQSAIQKVRWRGRRWYRGRHHGGRWIGPVIGAGIAAAIIGGAVASSRRDYRDRWERCDEDFRTFSWEDGTYIPYVDSPRVLCPYLRG